MLRKKIGTILATCGVLMVVFGISTMPSPEVASAMPAPQPSPRPTIVATPGPGQAAGGSTASGHITGTVIDLNTGAPIPGVMVNVGGTVVTTDANGNYDHWAPVGVYSVTLVLTPDQGTVAQNPQTVEITADSATIQHLNFHGKVAENTAPAGATSVPASQADAEPAANMPKRLPRTSEETNTALLWMIAGMGLLMAGAVVGLGSGAGRGFGTFRPAPVAILGGGTPARQAIRPVSGGRGRARPAPAFDSSALLNALLATEPPPARVRDPKVANAALLRSLLEREL